MLLKDAVHWAVKRPPRKPWTPPCEDYQRLARDAERRVGPEGNPVR
jgi:hypothetical protein